MVFSIAACYGFKPSDFNIFKVFESNGEDIGVSDNRHINFISISRLIKEVSKEIISEVTESGLKKTSEFIKYIPVVGTIIGGFASSLINAGFTANFGKNCLKSFEKNLLGNDHGFTYLKNRIDIYKDIFSQISFLSQKDLLYLYKNLNLLKNLYYILIIFVMRKIVNNNQFSRV